MKTSMVGRAYLDPGDRWAGRSNPPRRCVVLVPWGPGGGPRNIKVRYDDGSEAVIPFARRLRRVPEGRTADDPPQPHLASLAGNG